MKSLRVLRVNGDSLSCTFSPTGALSSAILCVERKRYDVACQLPGLTETNADEYLTELGYTSEIDRTCIQVGKEFNQLLQSSSSLFVEQVQQRSGQSVLSVVLREHRSQAFCPRVFVAFYAPAERRFSFAAIRSKKAVDEFLDRLLDR
jgi:hypothetical protein